MTTKRYATTHGLNLKTNTDIKDNEVSEALNMFYNAEGDLETRRGFKPFGDAIDNKPITSIYFHKFDSGVRILIATSGTSMYKYIEDTGTWETIATGLAEYEANGTTNTRWSFAPLNDVLYMCNGIDPYSKLSTPYTSTEFSNLGYGVLGTVTFTNATNTVNIVGHGLVSGDTVDFTTTGALPAEIDEKKTYYVINENVNDFQISLIVGGSIFEFTDDGSITNTVNKITQPKARYLKYMKDRVFGGGVDASPQVLYYTDALIVSSNAEDIGANNIKVGGDEQGIINGLKELGGIAVVMKDLKKYQIGLSSPPTADELDVQFGGYSHRAIESVGNDVLYYTGEGIDGLTSRTGVSTGQGFDTKLLSDNVTKLIQRITPRQRNINIALYADKKYYFTFDTGDDGKPDTTLVRSSLKPGGWTQYSYPSIYDYSIYENAAGEKQILFAPATSGQSFQMESGFNDNGQAIQYRITSKAYNQKTNVFKKYPWIVVEGFKSKNFNITVKVLVKGQAVKIGQITDNFIDLTEETKFALADNPLGDAPIAGSGSVEGVELFKYSARIDIEKYGPSVQLVLESNIIGGIWTLSSFDIDSEKQNEYTLPYKNII